MGKSAKKKVHYLVHSCRRPVQVGVDDAPLRAHPEGVERTADSPIQSRRRRWPRLPRLCRAPSRYARRTEARLASRHSPRCVPFSAGGAVQRVRPAARGVAIQVRPLALAARDEPLPIHPLECPPSRSPIGLAFAPCVARRLTEPAPSLRDPCALAVPPLPPGTMIMSTRPTRCTSP